MSRQNVDASRRCQAIGDDELALALESNIMVNSTGMGWQRVCLPLKSYIVNVDNQVIT
jgi:hypothetical protein